MNPEHVAKAGTEHAHQCAIFCWREMAARRGFAAADDMLAYDNPAAADRYSTALAVAQLRLLYAIKNAGHGDAIRGARNRAEGITSGIPDVCLPVARASFHALYVELKRPKKSRVASEQAAMHELLRKAGNHVVVCAGWRNACDAITAYLRLLS